MSFADLKRKSTSSFDKLNQELAKLNTSNSKNNTDDRIWQAERDKAGNGYAVIRFLPAPDGEDLPFVRKWDHGFQGPGGWYIENSLTSIGEEDPVGVVNSKLWNTGSEADKETARKQKRRLSYYSNVYVISDPAKPENEGKVFIYKYGKKIFDKLNDLMQPQFEDESPINPFDMWTGANFKLKIRMVEKYPNYDKSEFDKTGPLFKDDDKLEEVWKQCHSLQSLVDKKNFKTYAELEAKLNRALGLTGVAAPRQSTETEAPAYVPKSKVAKPQSEKNTKAEDEDEDDLAFFNSLVDDE